MIRQYVTAYVNLNELTAIVNECNLSINIPVHYGNEPVSKSNIKITVEKPIYSIASVNPGRLQIIAPNGIHLMLYFVDGSIGRMSLSFSDVSGAVIDSYNGFTIYNTKISNKKNTGNFKSNAYMETRQTPHGIATKISVSSFITYPKMEFPKL